MLKITLITVSYNAVNTIEETICSVIEQNYKNIEYIIVDGNSNDGTALKINKHKDYISKFISEPDNGIYDAMNKGISMATGDIIGFLNSDDIYANSNVIKIIADTFENISSIDMVYGDAAFFKSDQQNDIVRIYSSKNFSPDNIQWGWMPAHPTIFVKRNIFDEFGGFKTNYKIAGDYEFIARIFSRTHIKYKYIPEILVKMRMGGISTGGLRNTLILNSEVIRGCKENNIDTNWLKIISKYPKKIIEFIY